MNSPMAETPETTDELATNCAVPGLWKIAPTDMNRLGVMLPQAWRIKEIWDDEARANPAQWFTFHFLNPQNMLFDLLNGKGLVAFIRTVPSWRSQVYCGVWHKDAMRRDDLFKDACRIMMLTNDLLVLDSFVKLDNNLSQRATLRNGFKYRGIIRNAQCYNGAQRAVRWNEIDRATLGLEET